MRHLFFLSCGSFRVPSFVVGPTRRSIRGDTLSLTVAVVVRDDGAIVLVDAGWSEETCRGPARSLGVRAAFLGVRARAGDSIASQLGALGFDPARVTTIIATHLHLDHVGGLVDFPEAELVCSEAELAAHREGLSSGYRRADLARAGRLRAVALVKDPVYGFPASHDLYGDGEVVVLDARGHTRGSVAVALRDGRTAPHATYVHIGDAAYQRWEYGVSPPGPGLLARFTAWDRRELAATYARIRACEADPRHPVIVPSHDPVVFASLPRSPRAS